MNATIAQSYGLAATAATASVLALLGLFTGKGLNESMLIAPNAGIACGIAQYRKLEKDDEKWLAEIRPKIERLVDCEIVKALEK